MSFKVYVALPVISDITRKYIDFLGTLSAHSHFMVIITQFTNCMFRMGVSVISIGMFISGANDPLQRWEMCVETLQRFMGFALASMQDLALDETTKNAATNVVSVMMVNGIYSGNNAR